jgi:hypothetical protein
MDDVSRMCSLLGVPQAPLVTSGVQATISFFRDYLQTDRFSWMSYIKAIDFHHPVRDERLPAGTTVSRHRYPGEGRVKPFEYFTKPGTSPLHTGTSYDDPVFELYKVPVPTRTLVSIAAPAKFNLKDQVSRLGGGIQYILSSQDAGRLIRVPAAPSG